MKSDPRFYASLRGLRRVFKDWQTHYENSGENATPADILGQCEEILWQWETIICHHGPAAADEYVAKIATTIPK